MQRVILNPSTGKSYKRLTSTSWWSDLTEAQREHVKRLHAEKLRYTKDEAVEAAIAATSRKRGRDDQEEEKKDKEKESKRPKVDVEEEEEEAAEITPSDSEDADPEQWGATGAERELLDWMRTDVPRIPGYKNPWQDKSEPYVRQIKKDDPSLACFNWAVRALGDEGPDPFSFFQYVVSNGSEGELTDFAAEEEGELRDRIRRAMAEMAKHSALNPRWRGDASGVKAAVHASMRILLELNGFQISDVDTGAAVVFHYKAQSGAGIPDHFWLEVGHPPLVIQTVAGDRQVEIGSQAIRYDPVAGPGRDTTGDDKGLPFTEDRIYVKALLPAHIALLQKLKALEDRTKKRR